MVTLLTPPSHRRPAFALVDVIVGTVILGVSLAVIIGLVSQALYSQQRGQDLATAAMLADEQLQLVLARGPDDYDHRFATGGPCDAPFESFHYSVQVSSTGASRAGAPTATGGAGGAYLVTATITWGGSPKGARASSAGEPQSLSIQTLIASREGSEDTDPDPDRRPAEPVERLIQ